ncbi:MAG: DUF1501 domain-containing protein [Pirellulaceae bacterium]|jgi:hypothetical protein|nr:DUF1501 domain-containing protein [Pirellulaceae bacterium]
MNIPRGMSRRHFMKHMAGASALAGSSFAMGNAIKANAGDLKKRRKSAILLWMGGGPSTMDIWDLKPGAATGGEFKPMSTAGDLQICEHMPMTSKVMDRMSVVRSMSTREADHGRGRYYMHTGYVPNPNMEHPTYGSVIAHELANQRPELEIPPFVSVGSDAGGPGFLGMAWAPFSVGSNGQVRNLGLGLETERLLKRQDMLRLFGSNFAGTKFDADLTKVGQVDRGISSKEHMEVIDKTWNLMTSEQMKAFKVNQESPEVLERYGDNAFGRGCMMARRLVEAGVPFIEVGNGGWDNHGNIFPTLRDNKLPIIDRGMSALVEDLTQRGLWEDTVVIWMGEFSRTPRINGNAGRDHWARSWSVAVGGGDIKGGVAVGATNEDGTRVITEPYSSEDLMASVCKGLGISLNTTFTSRNNRPMKIANSGKIIKDLFA